MYVVSLCCFCTEETRFSLLLIIYVRFSRIEVSGKVEMTQMNYSLWRTCIFNLTETDVEMGKWPIVKMKIHQMKSGCVVYWSKLHSKSQVWSSWCLSLWCYSIKPWGVLCIQLLHTRTCLCLGARCIYLCCRRSERVQDSASCHWSCCFQGCSRKSVVKALRHWPGRGERKWEYGRLPLEGKMEKIQRQEKAICQSRGKIQQLCAGFVGNTALCSVPEGKKTTAPDWSTTASCNNDSLHSHLWLKVIHDMEIKRYEDQMRCAIWFHTCIVCSLWTCVCVCVWAPWKALKWVALHRFLFVFTAQDQSHVALKLARRGLHRMSLLSNGPEEQPAL